MRFLLALAIGGAGLRDGPGGTTDWVVERYFELDQIELNAKQLLIVNCPGSLTDKGIEKVRKFVRKSQDT